MEVLNRQKVLCTRVIGGVAESVEEEGLQDSAHGEFWGDGVSRSVMLGMHRRQDPSSV